MSEIVTLLFFKKTFWTCTKNMYQMLTFTLVSILPVKIKKSHSNTFYRNKVMKHCFREMERYNYNNKYSKPKDKNPKISDLKICHTP